MAAAAPDPRPSERLAGQARAGLSGTAKVLAGFKEFISRGNAVELAVGVVIGAAFGGIVTSLQNDLISPLVGWIFGQPNLTDLWAIGPYSWQQSTPQHPISPIKVGAILNAALQFFITAAAVYFVIVLPLNALARRRARGQEPEPQAPAEDVVVLREIRDLLAARTGGLAGPTIPEPGPTTTSGPTTQADPLG
jgi:large conductance mechanosensitive channel